MNTRESVVKFLRKNMIIIGKAVETQRFKFHRRGTPLEQDYSGGQYFLHSAADIYGYKTSANVSRAQALLFLLHSGRIYMTCQTAQTLAIYATILDVLIEYKGEQEGRLIFDRVFNNLSFRSEDIYAGTGIVGSTLGCIGDAATIDLHPLRYFFINSVSQTLRSLYSNDETCIEPGMMSYFDNHPLHAVCAKYDDTNSRRTAVVCTSKTATETYYMTYGMDGEVNATEINKALIKALTTALNSQPNSLFKVNPNLTHKDVPGLNLYYLRHIDYDALTRLIMQPEQEIARMQEWLRYEARMVRTIRACQQQLNNLSDLNQKKKFLLNGLTALEKLMRMCLQVDELPLFSQAAFERLITMHVANSLRNVYEMDDYELLVKLHDELANAYLAQQLMQPAIRHLEFALQYARALQQIETKSDIYERIAEQLTTTKINYYGMISSEICAQTDECVPKNGFEQSPFLRVI